MSKVNHYFCHVDNLQLFPASCNLRLLMANGHPPTFASALSLWYGCSWKMLGKLGGICEDMVNLKSKKKKKANVPHGLLKSACEFWMYVLLLSLYNMSEALLLNLVTCSQLTPDLFSDSSFPRFSTKTTHNLPRCPWVLGCASPPQDSRSKKNIPTTNHTWPWFSSRTNIMDI